MESNVAEETTIDTLVPFEIEPRAQYRGGDEPDEERIEEIRRRGVRPSDAERIERLERELDLEEEFSELRRVWAASVLRANPGARPEARRRIMVRLREDNFLPYDALTMLKDLELVDEGLDFARLRTEDWKGNPCFELILYDGREAKYALELRSSGEAILKDVSLSGWYSDLPE